MNGKQILFLGTHGQYNIGDELLLETFLEQLGGEHAYTINSYDPEFTTEQLAGKYNAAVFHTTDGKWQLPRLIWRSELIFFGGGSVIKELYKNVGRNRYATLMMILVIVSFAHLLARKPIIMSNIGVGPIQTRLGMWLAGLILRQATLVSVRDANSYQSCRSLGVKQTRLLLTPDAVFVNRPDKFGQVLMPEAGNAETLKVALNLNYNIENSANWQLFLDRLAESLRYAHQRRPIEIHALPMQAGFKPNTDLEVLQAFKGQLGGDFPMVIHEPATPLEVGRIISACDLVVAERLHSLVIASILRRPFVALVYDVKVQQLVEFLGMGQYAIDINRPFDSQHLANQMVTAYERRSELTEQLAQSVDSAQAELDHYFESVNRLVWSPA